MPGPEDRDAAMVMGNSTMAWDRAYDMRFQQRNAAAAVTAMSVWRQGMLGNDSNDVSPNDDDCELDVVELE